VPNKAIRHTELDHAIETTLSGLKAKARLDWKEIENILLKKTEPIPIPLSNYSYSLNSIAAVVSVNASAYLKSARFFTKRWATAIYFVTGGIIISTGAYFIYDFSRATVQEKEIINKPASVTAQDKGPEKTATASSAKLKPISTETPMGKPETKPELNAESNTEVKEESRPDENIRNKTRGNVEIKSDITREVKSEAPDFSRENTREAFDGTKETPPQSRESSSMKESSGQKESSTLDEDKKAKVLYYKENLSLDKLEQQLTTEQKDSLR